MNGSSKLTAEQQAWYQETFGVSPVAIQENHLRPSRRVRRALRYGCGRDVSDGDVRLYGQQRQLMKRLQGRP